MLASVSQDKKLLIIPAYSNAFGGVMVSLSLLLRGVQSLNMTERLRVLVRAGSLMERYCTEAGLKNSLEVLDLPSGGFFNQSLNWVYQQPNHWPLLLDNSVWRSRLPKLVRASYKLRRSKRPVFHFCHDLALSNNRLGGLARKFTFACLSPQVICNSHFTADHVRQIMPNLKGILYQPVDLNRIHRSMADNSLPPHNIRYLVTSGAKFILTPSRINQPNIVNDKNLRAIPPVLAALKDRGYDYYSVIIGEDSSAGKTRTQALRRQAQAWGVADRLLILPNTFEIEAYYRYADIVVTLAPREPFGRTVVEAIACGVPVVGSNTGGINEILQNFAPDWVVDPHNAPQVAEKIIQVIAGQDTQNILRQGQQWVRHTCSPETYASRMMQLVNLLPTTQSQFPPRAHV
ncbi:MAG: glycosyltransferase family 4 protein [Cyanobacteria bacterium J06627_3]